MEITRTCNLCYRWGFIFVMTLVLVFNTLLQAQQTTGLNKDSLKQIIVNGRIDTGRVMNLILLGQQYESNIPDSAIYYYKQANLLSEQLHYPAGIINYINNYTAVLNVTGKFDESLRLHQQSLRLCDQYGLSGLRLKTLLNMGVVYQYKEDYQAAADHYLKNLPLFEQSGDRLSLSVLYGNLCGLYRNLKQPEKALTYARKSVDLAEKTNNIQAFSMASINLANVLKDQGNTKEAELYLRKAYQTGQRINDINLQETALINLADMFSSSNQPDKYINLFKRAIPLADSLGDVYGKAQAMQGIAFGLYRKKLFRASEQQVNAGLAFARQNKQREAESQLLLLMSDIYIALGNLTASARYRNDYDSVYASVVNTDLSKNIQELETKYDVEKKQSEILQQHLLLEQKSQESLRQRLWVSVLIVSVLLLIFFIFWGFRFYTQRQKLNRKALVALQAEQENQRLQALLDGQLQERNRISQEMHDDMGSGLTSMLFLSRTIQSPAPVAARLQQTAQELIKKMNEIIWAMSNEQDTLDNLVGYMRLQIAETLENAAIGYSFSVSDPLPLLTVSQEFRRNIYLVSKEAVHNIIRHAAATQVTISICVTENLEIKIYDNGKGFRNGPLNGFGNGLKNMRERMNRLNGSFTITDKNGVCTFFSAPLPV